MATFISELTALLNRWAKDNEWSTPDYLLAEGIENMLTASGKMISRRDRALGLAAVSAPPKARATSLPSPQKTEEPKRDDNHFYEQTPADTKRLIRDKERMPILVKVDRGGRKLFSDGGTPLGYANDEEFVFIDDRWYPISHLKSIIGLRTDEICWKRHRTV